MSDLNLSSITRVFGSKVVLDGLSLRVEQGEFVAVLGHSGCGKSTLLRVIAGLDKHFSGSVETSG